MTDKVELSAWNGEMSRNEILDALHGDEGKGLCDVLRSVRPSEQSPQTYLERINALNRIYVECEPVFGISRELGRLQDRLSRPLAKSEQQQFAERFVEAIPDGCDTSKVVDQWFLWLLSDPDSPIAEFARENLIVQATALFSRKLADQEPSDDEWMQLRDRLDRELDAPRLAVDRSWAAARDGALYAAQAAVNSREVEWSASWSAGWALSSLSALTESDASLETELDAVRKMGGALLRGLSPEASAAPQDSFAAVH